MENKSLGCGWYLTCIENENIVLKYVVPRSKEIDSMDAVKQYKTGKYDIWSILREK